MLEKLFSIPLRAMHNKIDSTMRVIVVVWWLLLLLLLATCPLFGWRLISCQRSITRS